MRFNIDKCKVIHLGRNNNHPTYKIRNCSLENSNREEGLGAVAYN